MPSLPIPQSTIPARLASGDLKAATYKEVADQLAFLQSGTGAVLRSINSKIGEVISVKDFGGIGDGVASENTAFTKVDVAAVLAVSSGIYVPAGTYLLDANITITSNLIMAPGAILKVSGGSVVVALHGTVTSYGNDQFIEDAGGTFGDETNVPAAPATVNGAGHVVMRRLTDPSRNERAFVAHSTVDLSGAQTGQFAKAAILATARTNVTKTSGFAATAIGIIAQGHIDEAIEGQAIGALLEGVTGTGLADGQVFGAEIGVFNNSGVTGTVDGEDQKWCIFLAPKHAGGDKITGMILSGGQEAQADFGIYLRKVEKEFIHLEGANLTGCIGINMLNDAQWGQSIILPSDAPLSIRNSGGTPLEILNLRVSGTILEFGKGLSTTIEVGARMIPNDNATLDLGAATLRWRDIHFNRSILDTGGDQVITTRQTGWSTTTGTEIRTNFADASLSDTSQALRALIVDLKAHGVIGT